MSCFIGIVCCGCYCFVGCCRCWLMLVFVDVVCCRLCVGACCCMLFGLRCYGVASFVVDYCWRC